MPQPAKRAHAEKGQSGLRREVAYKKIREGIIAQRWRPGDPLAEQQIAEELSVSRTPVREALHALAREGLVDIFPSRGTFVSSMSTDDLREIYQFREALEVQLVRLVVQRATEADMIELEEVLRRENKEPAEPESVVASGSLFHRTVARIGGNRRIDETLRSLEHATLRARVLGFVRAEETRREHRLLAEAIRARDEAKAEALMRRHLAQAFEHLTGQPYVIRPRPARDE
jgi:GntR family transcriptional regulator, rspAB operon transcriptional repressor